MILFAWHHIVHSINARKIGALFRYPKTTFLGVFFLSTESIPKLLLIFDIVRFQVSLSRDQRLCFIHKREHYSIVFSGPLKKLVVSFRFIGISTKSNYSKQKESECFHSVRRHKLFKVDNFIWFLLADVSCLKCAKTIDSNVINNWHIVYYYKCYKFLFNEIEEYRLSSIGKWRLKIRFIRLKLPNVWLKRKFGVFLYIGLCDEIMQRECN